MTQTTFTHMYPYSAGVARQAPGHNFPTLPLTKYNATHTTLVGVGCCFVCVLGWWGYLCCGVGEASLFVVYVVRSTRGFAVGRCCVGLDMACWCSA
jgi:hypothetical protein